MKSKKHLTGISGLLLVFVVLSVFMGCASAPEVSYADRWEKTIIGMSLDEFKQVWPEAKFSGYTDMANTTEVWTYTKRTGVLSFDQYYFNFQDKKLIKFTQNTMQ